MEYKIVEISLYLTFKMLEMPQNYDETRNSNPLSSRSVTDFRYKMHISIKSDVLLANKNFVVVLKMAKYH